MPTVSLAVRHSREGGNPVHGFLFRTKPIRLFVESLLKVENGKWQHMEISKKWGAIYFCCILVVVSFFGLPLYMIWDLAQSKSPSYPALDDWLLYAFMSIFMMGSGAFLLWECTKVCLLTSVEETGIRQRRLLGWIFIPWNEVTVVEQKNFSVEISSKSQMVVLTPTLFKNWSSIAHFIRERTDADAFQLSARQIDLFN